MRKIHSLMEKDSKSTKGGDNKSPKRKPSYKKKVVEDMEHEEREKDLMNEAAEKHKVKGISKKPGEKGYEEEEERVIQGINSKMAGGGKTPMRTEQEEDLEENEDSYRQQTDDEEVPTNNLAWLQSLEPESDFEEEEETEEVPMKGQGGLSWVKDSTKKLAKGGFMSKKGGDNGKC